MPFRIFAAGRENRRHLLCARHDLRAERCPKLRIADDTNRVSATVETTGQQRIIRQDRSDADHDPSEAMTLCLYMLSRSLTGHPAGSPFIRCDFSVHRHRIFHRYEWPPGRDIVHEYTIQRIAFRTQHALGHLDAMCPQKLDAPSCDQRIRVS